MVTLSEPISVTISRGEAIQLWGLLNDPTVCRLCKEEYGDIQAVKVRLYEVAGLVEVSGGAAS